VSHAIRGLEGAVGQRLVDRRPSGAALTPAGALLAEHLREGFSRIDQGVARTQRHSSARSEITISASTSLVGFWLMPRMARCKSAFPEIDLRCLTSDNDSQVGIDGADLWIPMGPGPWDDLRGAKFAEEDVVPVAAPDLAESLGSDPVDLLDAPLIHLEERYPARYDWHRWFESHGVNVNRHLPGATSNDYSVVLQSAIDGHGVALGWLHIVGPLIRAGTLRAVGGPPVRTPHPFMILCRPDSGGDVVELRNWLVAQALS